MKPKAVPDTGRADYASRDGMGKMPELAEWMTAAAYEDGSVRLPPTMTLFCQNGEWRASLRDRQEKLVLFLSARTWADLFKMINEFCLSDLAPWRHDDDGHERNGKRVKSSGR